MERISEQTTAYFALASGAQDKVASADFKNVPLRKALDKLLKGSGLGWRRIGGSDTYLIRAEAAETPGYSRIGVEQSAGLLDARVTVRLHNAPLFFFLRALSHQVNIHFTGDPIENRRISVDLPNVTVREALEFFLELEDMTARKQLDGDMFVLTRVHRETLPP